MSARIVSWESDMTPMGSAVVAIGVFDGVHLGHQALLADTVGDAAVRGVEAVAVTFDRDPDQVVSPETAAPQLLTLSDKLEFIAQTGVHAILVIPFTHELAEMCPEEFLDAVLLRAVKPLAVHVGGDFRFGCRATGDVATLQRIGVEHGLAVVPHDLVLVGGAPVTSSRTRALVAEGDVVSAAELLGRATAVVGTVHRGRGQGASLGFPTANVVPVDFAALPADGVYAGRAILPDGGLWAAAISVGTPPTFPEARDYLEAHLIGFEGDLYDAQLTLLFFARLRSQESYASLDELKSAIADDVNASLEIAGFAVDGPGEQLDPNDAPFHDALADGTPVVSDPGALAAAEREASHRAPVYFDDIATGEWIRVAGPVEFYGSLGAGPKAFMVTAPLEAAGIPFVWDPYPPDQRPQGLPGAGSFDQPFTLLVPVGSYDEALALTQDALARESVFQDDSDDYIDDPAALEAAEQAVRAVDRPARALSPEPLDGWKTVASDMGYDKHRLGAIEYALSAAGVPAEWKPFSPTEAPLLKLFGLRETKFALRVPSEDAEAARLIVREVDDRTGEGAET
jgi:riboflavin kinase/FMN adenylyltransferase